MSRQTIIKCDMCNTQIVYENDISRLSIKPANMPKDIDIYHYDVCNECTQKLLDTIHKKINQKT